MRFRRLLTPLAIAATTVALAGGPAAAAAVLDIKSYPGGPVCTGDTFSGVVRVTSTERPAAPVPGKVELQYNKGGRVFTATGATRSFSVTTGGSRDYPFSFDIRGLPAGSVNVVASTVLGDPAAPIETFQSKIIPLSSCAPAEVVPEAPSALVIPLSLAATAGLTTLAIRRRPTSSAATA